jgi:hypothetical protein
MPVMPATAAWTALLPLRLPDSAAVGPKPYVHDQARENGEEHDEQDLHARTVDLRRSGKRCNAGSMLGRTTTLGVSGLQGLLSVVDTRSATVGETLWTRPQSTHWVQTHDNHYPASRPSPPRAPPPLCSGARSLLGGR